MFNRSIFAQKTNSLPKHQSTSKPITNLKQLTSNKINIRRCNSNQSTFRLPNDKKVVKIIPQKLQFESTEQHQLYEIPFYVRNESSQLQKVRIIPPVKKQFKIKFAETFNNEIAAGLAVKVSVLFCSDDPFEMIEDKIIIMGNSFKEELPLVAEVPKSSFVFPKVLNVGSLIVKQQKKIEIPIKNIGSKVGIITIEDIRTSDYCPHINYPNKNITVLPGKTQSLEINVKPSVPGELEVKVQFSTMDSCIIKAIVLEDQVEIVDENGTKVSTKDFGELFIGERLNWPFFIVNSTQNTVDCILKTLNKKKQNTDIKVDKKRNIFISQTSPHEFSVSVQSSCLSLEKNQMNAKPFNSEKNLMYVQKVPTKEQIDIFLQNLTKNIQSTIYKVQHSLELNRSLALIKDPNEIDLMLTGQSNKNNFLNTVNNKINEKDKVVNETLAVRFSTQEKILKIPIKFVSKIPNLEINLNALEFGKLFVKDTEEKQFVLKNHSNRPIKLNFGESTAAFKENFKIEGPQVLDVMSESRFRIKFRPLIKKKFAEVLKIKVFDHFPIEIKIFGECLGLDSDTMKNQMSLTMRDRTNETMNKTGWRSLLKDKTARHITESIKEINLNKSLNKTARMSQSTNLFFSSTMMSKTKRLQKSEEQMARVMFSQRQQNMSSQKLTKESLFFKKEQFLTSTRKNKPYNHPSNLRELLRYQGLSLQELKKIEVQEQKLQFGHIFVGSTTSKKLTIKNKLEHPVLIELDTQGAEALSQNSNEPIRLEGFGTYEANIILRPTQLGDLQLPLNYIINKQHVFEVKVLAMVTLVNLELSARSFVFNFSEDDPSFEKQAILQVYNNGNKKAKFMFDQPQNPAFKLSVLQGQLEPKNSMSIKIVYSPMNGHESGDQRVDVQRLKMKVHEGAENIIKCTGTVKQPKISIKQTELNNQNSIVSVPINSKISIRNFSKVSTYAKVEFEPVSLNLKGEDISGFISIENTVYLLNADDKKQISFTFLCHEVKKIEMNVIVSIRGYNVVKIPYSVNVVHPQIKCTSSEINFHDVPILSNHCIEMFSLVNKTQCEIKLEIDPTYPKDEYFCEILAVKDKNMQSSYEDEKYRTFLNSFIAAFRDNRRLSKRRSIVCNKILTLPPGEESVFNVKFIPKCIMKYDFQLPLRIFGCSERVIKPVDLQIKCNAVEPVIYVQPRAIKFDMKVINQAKASYSQSVFISNPHNYQARFRIQPLMRNSQPLSSQNKKNVLSLNSNSNEKYRRERNSSKTQNVPCFSFSQSEGEIQPNGKIEIFVIFKAVCQGEFLEKYTIFLGPKTDEIKTLATSVSSYILDVSGSAIMPTLRFSCNQAIMPVVPLNIESRIFVMIQNHGYDAITICKWKTSNHFQHTDIKVNFIEGKLLSLAKKSLRVEIIFSSLAPVSFTTMLEFYDEYGNKYELPLSCTADNSIFTCFPYLESDNQQTILYNSEEKLIKIMPTGKNSYYEPAKHLSGSHTMTCNFIQKWINFQLNMNIKSYPESMIESEGKDFVKLINRMSSKNMIRRHEFTQCVTEQDDDTVSQNYQKSTTGKILSLIELYSQTIKKLKQEGAFLNQIRPQFLLNYSQFVIHQNFKRKMVCSQAIFEVVSVESWISLFYQLCKVYVQPQITQKLLSKLKIQPSPIPEKVTSNLYSSVEIALLKFINFYLVSEEGSGYQSALLINLTEHIKIFQVIHRLLENCFKLSLTEQINTLKNSVSIMSPHVFLSSIAKFLFTHLKEFGLSAYLTPTDLFSIGVKELVLYLINLLQMIYHYSNASLIKFEGAVGDKITKVIELENPTSKKVNYFVKIVNHNVESPFDKDHIKTSTKMQNNNDMLGKSLTLTKSDSNLDENSFIPETTQITIGPKQKAELKVVYRCKNAKGETANLYLIPTKEDDEHTIPQPLMFKLTTTILSKILMKKINVTTTLYEVLPIHLDIELPSQIPESAEFNLSLFEQASQNDSIHSYINPQSFIFSQSHIRTLKQGNKDSFEIKLVPLNLGDKMCKISYFSSLYGQFIYEIHAKITNPKPIKEFKVKDLKVNVQDEVSIVINKQNDIMNSLLKVYYPELYSYHNRTERNTATQNSTRKNISGSSKFNLSMLEKASARDLKYEVEIVENPFVTLVKGYNCIEKLQKENKIVLKTNFTKPFKEFSVMLSVKNEFLKDRRFYKIVFVVISPPKIVKLQFKTSARQPITQKIPVKISPCEVSLKSNCDCFTVENLNREYLNNTDLVCHFSPQWMQEKQATIEIQNKESLEQIIYEISLKAEQPQKFGTFELVCSSLFNEQVSIPIDVQTVFSQIVQEETKQAITSSSNFTSSVLSSKNLSGIYFDIKRLFKRSHSIENEKFYPFLHIKNQKSLTGLKMNEMNMFNKDASDKMKASKTRSLVDDRSIKSINMVLHPSDIENETGSIRLAKPNSEEYYWAKIVLKNRPVKKLKPVRLQEKLNQTKIQSIDLLAHEEGIDFNAADFEFKFSSEQKYLKFQFREVQNSGQTSRSSSYYSRQKKPCLIFNPVKQIQTEQTVYFKSNNQEFMLPVYLRAQPMPTILVPEITTINIDPKITCINLINSSEEAGIYKVVVSNSEDPSSQSWKFMDSQQNPSYDWIESDPNKGIDGLIYYLKPKEKKEIKVCFKPLYIHQKEKFVLKFESQTLPDYTYILNGRSEFKIQEEDAEFQVYEDHIRPFHINFSNLFQRKQYFSIDLQTVEGKQPTLKIDEFIKIEEPVSKKFDLQQGEIKGILLTIKESYFKLSQEMFSKKSQQNQNEPNFKFVVSIRIGEKVVKKFNINLLVIKNLFSKDNKTVKIERTMQKYKTRFVFDMENETQKQTIFKNKNFYNWSCKARETIYETIQIPRELNLSVKEIKCAPEILKFLTFTCTPQNQESTQNIRSRQTNNLKIKYSPMKPLKKDKYDFILVGTKGQKYRIQCEISVDEPAIDDTIIIKTTEIDQTGCVSFKLTNTTKCSAKYRAHFVKKLPEFSVQADHGVLQGYGKPGTPIMVKFRSHINNRRLEDRLIIETDDMYWCFKVKGMLSKDGH